MKIQPFVLRPSLKKTKKRESEFSASPENPLQVSVVETLAIGRKPDGTYQQTTQKAGRVQTGLGDAHKGAYIGNQTTYTGAVTSKPKVYKAKDYERCSQ